MVQKFFPFLLVLFLLSPVLYAQEKQEIATGTLITQSFVNKRGKVFSENQQIYFRTQDQTFFIKFSESKITYPELKKRLDQPITLKIIKKEGLWDRDDQEFQSRSGEYIIVLEIMKL